MIILLPLTRALKGNEKQFEFKRSSLCTAAPHVSLTSKKIGFFEVRGGCTQAKAKVRVIGFDCKIQFAILKLIVTDFSAIQCIV